MTDPLIATTERVIRAIVEDAVNEAVQRLESVPELLSFEQIAARLDVTADTVRQHRHVAW